MGRDWSGCPDLSALNGPVDGGSTDGEQFGQFTLGMRPGGVQFHQVGFLFEGELGLFPAEPALGLGNLHPFAGSHADEIGFELGDHRQHIEQEFPHWVGGVVDGATNIESDFSAGEVICDFMRVPDGTGQAVKFSDDQGIPGPASGQGLEESGTVLVSAGEAVINVYPLRLDAEALQGIALGGEVLFFRGHACVADQ